MNERLRVVIADDERPARSVLKSMLTGFPDVELVGEAEDGTQALNAIERLRPDLAILDVQMPELDGPDVVRMLKKKTMPLIAFVTAYEQHAVQAFELNAVDYLLKPIDGLRLRDCVNRAIERLEASELRDEAVEDVRTAAEDIEAATARPLRRVPVRRRDETVFIPVESIAAIVAEHELLHISTASNERYTICHRLKDLEARLDPEEFVRVSRGALVNAAMIARLTHTPGGTFRVHLTNGLELGSSRLQSRVMRAKLLRL